jgi:hypothetical protein
MAPNIPFPDDVPVSQRIIPTGPVGSERKETGMPTQPFQSFMQQPSGALTPRVTSAPSPFELSQGQQSFLPGKPTFDTLLSQVNSAQQSMGDLSNQLNTPNLRLNRAQRYLLGNKLSDAKAHIRSAATKFGVEESPEESGGAIATPLGKFLAMLTDGQYQLQAAKEQLQKMQSSGKQLHPADFLLIQVKLNKAQVEIEYSSVLLSKAIDAMKQLFNIQL